MIVNIENVEDFDFEILEALCKLGKIAKKYDCYQIEVYEDEIHFWFEIKNGRFISLDISQLLNATEYNFEKHLNWSIERFDANYKLVGVKYQYLEVTEKE